MAAAYRLRATMCAPVMRACQGRQASRVAQARKEILQRKVYNRGDTSRPLSGRLLASERIRFRGPVAEISNVAPYAQIRNDMTGTAKDGHDLELGFAQGAIEQTAPQNRADVRAAMRSIMASGR